MVKITTDKWCFAAWRIDKAAVFRDVEKMDYFRILSGNSVTYVFR